MMRKKSFAYAISAALICIAGSIILMGFQNLPIDLQDVVTVNKIPHIDPDYSGVTIPPNIAPLNFCIQEKAAHYGVILSSEQGKSIRISSRKPSISIPGKSWKKLLASNQGQTLSMDIYLKTSEGAWEKYKPIMNHIAEEEIDPYLVYRKIHPSHNTWRKMGLYQRNVETYQETPVLKNESYRWGCAHCHTFNNHQTDKIAIGVRSADYKSCLLIVDEDKQNSNADEVYKILFKFGFTSWHPSGKLLACTINNPPLVLHTSKNEMRDIVDVDSWIGYYRIGEDGVRTIPKISQKDWLENYPTWSPDGKYLYFCNTLKRWKDAKTLPPEGYDESKYSLYRIGYDIDTDQWGDAEPILMADETGLSMNQPLVSPDGRWLTFSMCEYSCWPSYHPDSDLYILDLDVFNATGKAQYRKMEISTDECESWHSWSSNGRWIAFSSKKNNPLFNRTYLSYVDTQGILSKAFVLPQKDPAYYRSDLNTYTIPELLSEPVRHTGETLARVIREKQNVEVDMPISGATPTKQN